jgi:hypothetical protein
MGARRLIDGVSDAQATVSAPPWLPPHAPTRVASTSGISITILAS